jgi:hypothetical protein
MPVPSQMFKNTLNPLKGWPSPTALDFVGQLHSAVTISPLPAGRCVHVDSITAITAGYGPGPATGKGGVPLLKTGVVGTQMGLFTFQGSQDFDVSNPSSSTTNASGTINDWFAVAPVGNIMCLVATGAYELETTEFDTAQTYLPNQPLRAVSADTVATAGTGGGCLTNQGVTVGTNAFVGVVSRGVYTNAYGVSALAFWPVYDRGNGTN